MTSFVSSLVELRIADWARLWEGRRRFLMEKPKTADRIEALAEEVIDMLGQVRVSTEEEEETDWTAETRNVAFLRHAPRNYSGKCLSLMAGNVAASMGEATTVEVAAAVQRKLEGHRTVEEGDRSPSIAVEEEEEGFCQDGFFSEVRTLLLLQSRRGVGIVNSYLYR